tara:strand:- start:180 stop:368 length:189 start_codon:yes stop_codon:yes gene_type:complete
MKNIYSKKLISFLKDDIGISDDSIELGIKLSIRDSISLPIALWSYGLITSDELDRFYNFIWD